MSDRSSDFFFFFFIAATARPFSAPFCDILRYRLFTLFPSVCSSPSILPLFSLLLRYCLCTMPDIARDIMLMLAACQR